MAETNTCTCNKCGHVWQPKKNGRPESCPRCKSYKWDSPEPKKENGKDPAGVQSVS